MSRTVLLFVNICLAASAFAQDFGYGFKAGMNFNTFISDGETDDAGIVVEDFGWNSGFHVGATFTWKATELMGARGELMFSQKGGNRTFEGPSYYIFTPVSGDRIFTTGARKMSFNVTNSYMAIPVMGYFKPVQWLEIYAGGSVGFLISSTAFGELTYEGTTANGAAISKFTHEIDASYFGDNAGEADFAVPAATVKVGNENVPIPQTAGAYFEFSEDRGKLYRVVEAGVLGGLSFYFNKGLYVSFRANYGLSDLTKDKADVSLVKLDSDKQFISRNDKDRSLSLQASIGFSF